MTANRYSLLAAAAGLMLAATGVAAGALEEGQAAFEAGRYEAAFMSFSRAFADGDGEGAYAAARMLELGLGVDRDPVSAAVLYRRGMEAGHPACLNRVALMYYRGEQRVGQNYPQALALFARAAEAGDANGTFNLGKMYFEGKGTDRDIERALALYRQAGERDHVLALNTLGSLYKSGSQEGDLDKARGYFERSAQLGNALGLYETALFHLHDGDSPQNLRAAHTNLNLASARGFDKASEALEQLTASMRPDDVAAAQANARAFKAAPAPKGD
ncbi:sel1 repeat family protein [Neorhizobium sp. T786]|uniref:tetratricopeptide repeat protein n=1 Tax=Pseudorhizobium xiangyangii TaxID=2883104 RepID=UPI001CFF6B99|nr:tetratricopeptide repeat protein [Neorhizobium xiangyangii]MCB5205370.1 sel1 repeat family protein [Neorhizobium xiangyangii]